MLVGLKKQTGEYVNADDVDTGLDCGCICIECGTQLFKAGGKERQNAKSAHFRHYYGGNDLKKYGCKGGKMSYYHKVAMRCLSIDEIIEIPEICFEMISFAGRSKASEKSIRKQYSKFIKELTPLKNYKDKESMTHKFFLQTIAPERQLADWTNRTIKSIEVSKLFNNVEIDIWLTFANGESMGVEVFYTNRVKISKREKLQKLDIDCIEVDISDLKNEGWNKTKTDIIDLVLSLGSRKWLSISTKTFNRLFEAELADLKEFKKPFGSKQEKENNYNVLKKLYEEEVKPIESRIEEIEEEYSRLIKELNYYDNNVTKELLEEKNNLIEQKFEIQRELNAAREELRKLGIYPDWD